jgi:serine/threonine-protein kinase PknG
MDGDKCLQPGCDGLIEGGFCNRCGLEATGVAAATAGSAAAPGSAKSSVGSSLSGRFGSRGSRRGSGSIRTSSGKNLGLGLVTVPDLPPLDPQQAVMAEPQVPEHKRFCSNPDCHDEAGNPTPLARRQAGHCPQCGKRYSFVPTLAPGEVVGDQYEVQGCLAYGGLGWIYLAKDRTLNRWVVLKGLLNTEDEAAAAAAVAERQFLAAVKHPNIVGIYNFVKRGSEGFIVMEYVGGTSVKELRKRRGPLPPAEAIAYVHRILAAFAYLHRQGMVYCDMKPDNFMLEGDPPDVKLIDLGGVRLIDDPAGDIFSTRGYSAPEMSEGPSVVSDLYSLGRALAVLIMDFRFQSAHEHNLPSPAEQPVLAQHESLYRFLLRATGRDPDARFQSADEMAEQLAGVLREVVAGTVPPRPAESTLFFGDLSALHDSDTAVEAAGPALLPELKVNPEDTGANYLLTLAAVADPERQAVMLQDALRRFKDSVEVPLRFARTLIGTGRFGPAETQLAEIAAKDAFEWRVTWYRGLAALCERKPKEASAAFDRVYSELPGELAVKLALAVAADMAGDLNVAVQKYDLVSRTDPTFTTAAFGLARCLTRMGKRPEAVEAYQRVPATARLFVRAQSALARTLLAQSGTGLSIEDLRKAAEVVAGLPLEGMECHRLRAEVLDGALTLLGSRGVAANSGLSVFGLPFQEVPLRLALETELRQMARLEPERARQIRLVDRANEVRPRTWV